MLSTKLINKVQFKKQAGKCLFCDVTDYAVLDVHRIVPGEEGGKYTEFNSVCCCACCHRKIHDGQLKLDRKFYGTTGRWQLRYWDENGDEQWK